uniref:Uncharacterized protein n=1 Tax=Cannabis sativa TaxID=3483 RepID=A0A803Q1M1_CANSA
MNGGDEVVAAPSGPPQALDWKFSQVFGERAAGEEVQEGFLGGCDLFWIYCCPIDPYRVFIIGYSVQIEVY